MDWEKTYMTIITNTPYPRNYFRNGHWKFSDDGISVPSRHGRILLTGDYNGTDRYDIAYRGWEGLVLKLPVGASTHWIVGTLKRRTHFGEEIECMAGVEGDSLNEITGFAKRIDVQTKPGELSCAITSRDSDPQIVNLLATEIEFINVLQAALSHRIAITARYRKAGDLNRVVSVSLLACDDS